MGLSKQTKLYIQLGFSCLLFFTELGVGYWVGSIALIADAFHMLNDVVSLIIAVYAVKVILYSYFTIFKLLFNTFIMFN